MNLETSILSYRAATLEDIPFINDLRSDPEVFKQLKDPNLYPVHQTEEWIKKLGPSSQRIMVFHQTNSISYGYGISSDLGMRAGLIRIDNIDRINSNCCIGLDIHKSSRGQGLSRRIYKWLMDYLFFDCNFHSLYLDVLETNRIARDLYFKLGFKSDGVLRERIFRDGKYQNYITMSMLRQEYVDLEHERQLANTLGDK